MISEFIQEALDRRVSEFRISLEVIFYKVYGKTEASKGVDDIEL